MVSNRPGGILAGSAELMQLFNQASALHQAGRLDEAEALYKRVIEKDKRQFGAYNLLGVLSAQRGDLKAAIRYATQALKINPNSAETHVNLARMQAESQNHAAALKSLQQALAINPRFALAHNNAAALLLSLQRPTEALNHADQAVSLAANYADAWHNRGNILFSLGRFEEALTSYDRALSLVPADAQSAVGRANALHALQRYAEAIPAADHALRLNPNLTYLEGHRLVAKRHICDWTNHDAECAKVVGHVRQGVYAIEPLSFLVIASSAADQLKCAQQNVATHCPPSPTPAWRGEKYRHDRIRVGYLSADFGDHAVANQIAGVFEHHDRSRFETIAFAFGGPSEGAMRRRLRASFDRFIEVEAQSDADVAQLVRRCRDRYRRRFDGVHPWRPDRNSGPAPRAGGRGLSGLCRDHGRALHRLHPRGPHCDSRRTRVHSTRKRSSICRIVFSPTTSVRRSVPHRRVRNPDCRPKASYSAPATATRSGRRCSTSGCGCCTRSRAACCGCCKAHRMRSTTCAKRRSRAASPPTG